MARTTVDLDRQAFAAARAALRTSGVTETVNAALREAARRSGLAAFDVTNDIDGTVAEVDAGRRERGGRSVD